MTVKRNRKMKKCSHCFVIKSTIYFYSNPSSKDGLHPWCKDCRKKYQKDFKKNNPIKSRANDFNYRNKSKITYLQIEEMFLRQLRKCNICKDDLRKDWQLDHRIPRCLGGLSSISNLQILCPVCNHGKYTLSQSEYIKHCVKVVKFASEQALNSSTYIES
jgi:HNH endonuclease